MFGEGTKVDNVKKSSDFSDPHSSRFVTQLQTKTMPTCNYYISSLWMRERFKNTTASMFCEGTKIGNLAETIIWRGQGS